MHQTDEILARFPGPVTLYLGRRRKLISLAVYIGYLAVCAWLLFAEYPKTRGYLTGGYDTVMVWVSVVGCAALAGRAAILLLFPGSASLTLDADGFEIGHVFRRIRVPWRGVNDFRAEISRQGKVGGALKQIKYDDLAVGAERRGEAKVTRVLPDLYGQPRLHGEEFAGLMNEWRRRALAAL